MSILPDQRLQILHPASATSHRPTPSMFIYICFFVYLFVASRKQARSRSHSTHKQQLMDKLTSIKYRKEKCQAEVEATTGSDVLTER